MDRRLLIIQIPCYNEESTLGVTLTALPRQVDGFEHVEWLVIDDGSTDGTVTVARAHGVDHIVRLVGNQGLARAFMAGVESALRLGADAIVNLDADNQYHAGDIPALLAPIREGRAEMVVGARPIATTAHFSPAKKLLQRLGSWAVRAASRTEVRDAPSGFRAFSRDAALRLNVFSGYTYTLETIIQAGQKGLAVASVPVRTNPDLRPSRLVRSVPSYVGRSVFTILRIFVTYKPLRFFLGAGGLCLLAGVGVGVRWVALYFSGTPRSHVPSLILAAILALTGVQLVVFGLVADLLAVNRKLLEDVQFRLRRADVARHDEPSPLLPPSEQAVDAGRQPRP